MGRLMVKLLMRLLDGTGPEIPGSVVTPTSLVRRASA